MDFKELGARLGLEEDEFKELVELFVETGSDDFSRLQAAAESKDFEQVMKSAHTLSGAAGNLGLMDIHTLAKQIENQVRDSQLDGIDEAIRELKSRMEQVSAVVAG